MSYIDHLDAVFEIPLLKYQGIQPIPLIKSSSGEFRPALASGDRWFVEFKKTWEVLEFEARAEHYEVLECSDRLREQCTDAIRQLYAIPHSDKDDDIKILRVKDREYGGSWQRRGGPGAFFAAVRKWDRMVESAKKYGSFGVALITDVRAEGIYDDVGDLRRYLILWEAWRLAREAKHVAIKGPGDPGYRSAQSGCNGCGNLQGLCTCEG